MKVKRLRDGKIVEVEKHGDAMIDEDGKVMYFDEICEVDEPDWQQVRIDAAVAAMRGMLANPQTFEQIDHDEGYKEVCGGDKLKIVAKASVMYADALVAELKHCDDVYAECRRMAAINTASVCENMTKIQKELQKKGGDNGKSN